MFRPNFDHPQGDIFIYLITKHFQLLFTGMLPQTR